MDDYREAQRQKWLQRQQAEAKEAASSSAAPAAAAAAASSSSSTSAPAPSSSDSAPSAASSSSPPPPSTNGSGSSLAAPASGGPGSYIRRVHILPVDRNEAQDETRRFDLLGPELRRKRDAKELIKTGLFVKSSGQEFVVVKADPDEGVLGPETDYFLDGEPIRRFEKVQFICLWDFESRSTSQDPSMLFKEYISPYFRSIADAGDSGSVVTVGETLKIFDLDFQVMAASPTPPDIGIIDCSTMVYVDWDATPEFEKIHIVPFQDTLPNAYDYDVFNDYLRPYLTRHKHTKFNVNDHFTYQGVQFKVVCCEPDGPARIGRNTTIYCEGVLHPSLRNLLPPELLEQLSHLPPGLQMLLLNTEALANGYEERLMEVQEMLSRRRGLPSEVISQVEHFKWGENGTPETQTQCMVCLSDFSRGEEVRRLPCGHVFHAPCIDEWLGRSTDCPICKANVDRAVRSN